MFIHFSIMMIIYKRKGKKYDQASYDFLFHSIENNLRELGLGDVSVNKKMKELNKILYDILLKINKSSDGIDINKQLVTKYFEELNILNTSKYQIFEEYLTKFYHFCFDKDPNIMIKEALNFKN